jgi:hypothetical protein
MDPHARIGGIERHVMDKADAIDHPCGAVVSLRKGATSGVFRRLHWLEQQGMIAFVDPEERVQSMVVQGLERRGIGTQTGCGDEALEGRVVLAQLGHQAFGGLTFTIIFIRPIVLHHRLRHQGHHVPHVRMKNRCAQHLMTRGERTMAVDFLQTRGTVNGLGGNISRPIERQSIMPIKKRHQFQRLATLELPQDAREHRAEPRGGDRVKDVAPVRVARDLLNAVDGVPMALGPLLVTSQKRGRFEGQHGQGRHERIRSGHLGLTNTAIWQAGTAAVHQAQEHIGGEMLPSLRRNDGQGKPHHEKIKAFKLWGIFASMFTKGQCSGHGDHSTWRLVGNCCTLYIDDAVCHGGYDHFSCIGSIHMLGTHL